MLPPGKKSIAELKKYSDQFDKLRNASSLIEFVFGKLNGECPREFFASIAEYSHLLSEPDRVRWAKRIRNELEHDSKTEVLESQAAEAAIVMLRATEQLVAHTELDSQVRDAVLGVVNRCSGFSGEVPLTRVKRSKAQRQLEATEQAEQAKQRREAKRKEREEEPPEVRAQRLAERRQRQEQKRQREENIRIQLARRERREKAEQERREAEHRAAREAEQKSLDQKRKWEEEQAQYRRRKASSNSLWARLKRVFLTDA